MSDWAYALGAGLHNLQQSTPAIAAPGVYGTMLPPEASQPAPVAAPVASFMRGFSGQPAAAAAPAAVAAPRAAAPAPQAAPAGGMPGAAYDLGNDRATAGALYNRGYQLYANANGGVSAAAPAGVVPTAPAVTAAPTAAPAAPAGLPGFQDANAPGPVVPSNIQTVVRGGQAQPVGGGYSIAAMEHIAPVMRALSSGLAERLYLRNTLAAADPNRIPPTATPDQATLLRNQQIAREQAALMPMVLGSNYMYYRMMGGGMPGAQTQ